MLKGESLYDVENVAIVHHINNALRAHKLFQRDKDYIVKNGQVIIIDEFTGRMMEGRRYSDGLHQALEAKEHVKIQPENQTLASITFQNYFRLYEKLAGMTGTATTEAEEFIDIYNLDVVEVPTNRPMVRIDDHDEVYRTADEKYTAILDLIEDCKSRAQPVLVGTTSIEKSELLAGLLRKRGWQQRDFSDPKALATLFSDPMKSKVFTILNARYHEQEAYIVAQAGVPGAVTIATNMAGRGTDIQLGGNADMRVMHELADVPEGPERGEREKKIRAEVERLKALALQASAGGLYIIGTERHESRRIDNQLRGRSGRQGDPGHSKFFLSLQDDLMRIFGSDRMDGMLQKLGLKDGEAIVHPWINKALERAQAKVEAHNFDIRKNLLKFDNVMNDQRKVIFEQRIELMTDEHAGDTVRDMRREVIDEHGRQVHPGARLRGAVGRRGALQGRERAAQPRPSGQGLGGGGRHRRRRDPRAPLQGERRADGAQGRALRAGADARGREAGAFADARPFVARASRDARPSALGDRLPRLRAARSAQRIQDRELRALPAPDRQSPPRGHRAARARGDPAAPARRLLRCRPARSTTSTPRPAKTRWPTTRRRRQSRRRARRSATPLIPPPGARSAATSPAPAAQARNTSSATGW